ncbi:AraC-like DNA-binding protein [Bacillus pakistanensis]|uniref:AraC-like DNA-binding protein n=1 Tax=Rossellomorea pakistanensis TaxID=992288 RepID=A0ABS2NCJ3_9BACI|nr:AraC family transcriptional regulator [Bacillus pakistanensis]MBM7585540.1 AraC-like DNA-binding protein [Bacillus pakistanensis]
MKRKKLYWQLLIYFGIIILLFSSVTTYILFKESSEMFQKERSQNQKVLLEQAKKSIDTRIQVAFNALMQLQNSEDYKDYMRTDHNEDYYYRQLQVLKELKNNNSAFANFEYKIGVMSDDVVVTQDSTMNKQNFFKELDFSNENIKELQDYVHTSTPQYGNHRVLILSNVSNKKQNDYITLVRKETRYDKRDIIFFISFYAKSFSSFVQGKDQDGFGMVTKDEIKYLQTNLATGEAEDILNPKELGNFEDLNLESGYVSRENSSYDIHFVKSEILRNLNYVYFSPKPTHIGVMKELYVKSLLIGASLLVIGILMAAYLANRTIRPIKKIIHHLSQYQNYEGNNELLFIESTTSHISTMNENLKKAIEQNLMPLKQKFLQELVMGPIGKSVFIEKASHFDLCIKNEELKVMVVEVNSNTFLEENLSKEGILSVKHQILDILKEEVKPMFDCELFEYGYEKIVLIINQKDEESIVSKLAPLFSNMNEELQLNVITAIGDSVNGLENIYLSFENAQKILENRFALERKNILFYEDLKYLDQINFYYPLEVERSLIQLIVQGNKEKAENILNRVLEENLHSKKLTNNALSQFIFAIRGTINRILQNSNKTSKEIFGNETSTFLFELQKIQDKTQLEERIRSTFSVLLNQISTEECKEELSIASRFLSYIHHNYEKDISLNDLADEFRLSSTYISTIFKNHTGENYKDYLNKYRILKAREILESEEVKIKELAGRVGFNNVNTFIRTFKKYVGLPPGQYEKSF